MRTANAVLLAAALAGGCTTDTVYTTGILNAPKAPAMYSCGAQNLQDLVGQDISAFQALNWQGESRILTPDMPEQLEGPIERVNLLIDASGTITRVYCG